jgi:LAO/AO transport system kinase
VIAGRGVDLLEKLASDLGHEPLSPMAIDISTYVKGVLDGKRALVPRAITLVESTRPDHRALAQELLVELLPHAAKARRSASPACPAWASRRSSTRSARCHLARAPGRGARRRPVVEPDRRVSILGDKTRMERLAVDPAAFIRPSPTAGHARRRRPATRETIVVMEAAGYDVVLVETVGVGQSETAVANMVDTFLLLTLARTGDQLQGIKKGVLELADVIAVNKADAPHERDARDPAVRALAPDLEQRVRDGELTATLAAEQILRAFGTGPG